VNRDLPPPVAWRRVALPAVLVGAVLTAFSNGYGYDRDELYFAMLRPAWGYVDQPPVTPLVVHGLTSVYDGGPWLIRIPATLCAVACLVLTALIARVETRRRRPGRPGGWRRPQPCCFSATCS